MEDPGWARPVPAPSSLHLAHVAMLMATGGSSITNVIRSLAKQHARRGGRTTVVLSANREADVEEASLVRVDYREHCPREWFTRREYATDLVLGRMGRERPFGGRLYVPAVRALAELQPDWVFLHEGHYAVAALPRLRAAVPCSKILVHMHNSFSRSYGRQELRRYLDGADLILGVSEYMVDRARERLGALADDLPFAAVGNGVDADWFQQRGDAGEGQELRLLYVGQVVSKKGVHVILEALRLLPASGHIVLRVVGSSSHGKGLALTQYELQLREAARDLPAQVEFLPYQPQAELRRQYAWSDVLVVPSLFEEPFGLVVLEAMASGAVVVTSGRGGLGEAGGAAALTYDGSAPRLADLLGALTGDDLRRGARASTAHAGSHTWPVQYGKLLDLLAAAA